ncbi:MAG: hypothetical protein JSR99_09885 [Proteobacteria bacterium]|nr:hypothetical protein [Pseudomonadota bacterium]
MPYNNIRLVATATGAMLLATSCALNVAASQEGMPAIVAIIAVAIGTVVSVPAGVQPRVHAGFRPLKSGLSPHSN